MADSDDIYYTISSQGEDIFREKMSRFLSFAVPVSTEEEVKTIVKNYQNRYHDSRHVCWAYSLGPDGDRWQLNDNGEPSGTAGKPILGQIRSFGLTDLLVIVVRYFGGIKLGTSGLIAAYREAARLALEAAGKKECYRSNSFVVEFPYVNSNDVMKIVKSYNLGVSDRQFDNVCRITVDIRLSKQDEIVGKLKAVEGASVNPK